MFNLEKKYSKKSYDMHFKNKNKKMKAKGINKTKRFYRVFNEFKRKTRENYENVEK